MEQIRNYGDERQAGWCVYCGGAPETRDHVPSRVLLTEPYPAQLPVVPACAKCNNEFSKDESYFACLLETVLAGSVDAATRCPKVARMFEHSPALRARIAASRVEGHLGVVFQTETARVHAVALKLARGHVVFECNEPQFDEPHSISCVPIAALLDDPREQFECREEQVAVFPEVGSRMMQRLFAGNDMDQEGWLTVQPGRYRYRVEWSPGIRVCIVLREYLAIEVIWDS